MACKGGRGACKDGPVICIMYCKDVMGSMHKKHVQYFGTTVKSPQQSHVCMDYGEISRLLV